jgi:iron(III) transport system ATP-binding protein
LNVQRSKSEAPAASRVTAGVTFAAKLAFEHISHAFNSGRETLSDISFAAESGEVLCLLGPSGSGKTTLLRIAAGIEPQTAGRVLLNDREIAGPSVFMPPEQRSIGLVFQDFALFPHLTILDNVRFGLTALSREEARREAHIALSRVGLEHHAQSFPHVLSGGEQQRVALARAFSTRPKVLFADEPTGNLDARTGATIIDLMTALNRDLGTTLVLVTHDLDLAGRARRTIRLADGAVVADSAA